MKATSLCCLQFLGVLVSLDGDFRDSALCVPETENPERDLRTLTIVTLKTILFLFTCRRQNFLAGRTSVHVLSIFSGPIGL